MLNFDPSRFLRIQTGTVTIARDLGALVGRLVAEGADSLFFMGSGGAGILMQPAADLMRRGSKLPCHNVLCAEIVLTGHVALGPKSVVVMPSLSGTTKESIAAMEYVRARGATVISIILMAITGIVPILSHYGGFAMPSRASFAENLFDIRRIMVPAVLTNLATPVGGIIAFRLIAVYGEASVASYAVIGRIIPLAFCLLFSLSGSIGPIIGQNYGAGHSDRVRQCFNIGLSQMALVMLPLFLLCQWLAHPLMLTFTDDLRVAAEGELFLHIISLNFITIVLVFSCSGVFQGLGNTWPSLASSSLRVFIFVLPVLWLSGRSDFSPAMVWYCSAASVLLQGLCSCYLVRWQLHKKLTGLPAVA